ncbi:MAG TPA: phosphatase PAP2 family protein, partial [Patescibacteria group bacterium]|nr:phosphatase PAP2 family protein [Patescibacteria group bacterium]
MDHQIFFAINNLAGKHELFDKIAIFLSKSFIYYFVALLFLLWFLYRPLRRNVYLALVSGLVSRGIIVEVIKRVVNHPRPFEILRVHQLLADEEHGLSFPSGHAVVFFSLAFAFYGTKYFWPLFVLATIASLARIYVGVHFPSDILAGVVVAFVTVWAIK